MALIKCPECGEEVSEKALACPKCGCPINQTESEPQKVVVDNIDQANDHTSRKLLGFLILIIGIAVLAYAAYQTGFNM